MVVDLKWNDDWRDELKEKNPECYERLCNCSNRKGDILVIARLMKKYNPNKVAKDCFDRTIDWICDWNGQDLLKVGDYENLLADFMLF